MIPKNSLPIVRAPEHLWTRIQNELDHPEPSYPRWWAIIPLAAMIAVALWIALRPSSYWIETQQNVQTVAVGNIGTVNIQPQSRVRVLATKSNEHRLELAEGAIEATINAPPRLFIVDTKATTAIDLGCAYRMESDASGNGSLRVSGGWVALEKDSGEVRVPNGASCKIRAGKGAGTPYFSDASEAFQNAVDEFDLSGRVSDELLTNARVRDTLSLWHVMNAVEGSDRERIFNRMAELVPPPQGMAKEKAFTLEELAWHW